MRSRRNHNISVNLEHDLQLVVVLIERAFQQFKISQKDERG